MKYEPIKHCNSIEQCYSPHPFKNLQKRDFISLSMTMLDTASPSTFPPDIGEPDDTWPAELHEYNDQQKNDYDHQSIIGLNDKLFPAAKRRSKMRKLLNLAVDKPTWIQTMKNEFSRASEILLLLDCRIRARECKAGSKAKRRKVVQHLSKVSISQKADLRKVVQWEKKKPAKFYRKCEQGFV